MSKDYEVLREKLAEAKGKDFDFLMVAKINGDLKYISFNEDKKFDHVTAYSIYPRTVEEIYDLNKDLEEQIGNEINIEIGEV